MAASGDAVWWWSPRRRRRRRIASLFMRAT
jgi:hypothetical protein